MTVRRPPEVVFAALCDIDRYPAVPWPAVLRTDRTPPGPVREGTAWREVVRLAPGVRTTVHSRVTRIEAPERLGLHFRGAWFVGDLVHRLERVPEGTVLRQRLRLRLRGPLGLLAGAVDRALHPRLLARLAAMRAAIEFTGAAVDHEPDVVPDVRRAPRAGAGDRDGPAS